MKGDELLLLEWTNTITAIDPGFFVNGIKMDGFGDNCRVQWGALVKGLISTQGYCPRNNRSYHRWCEDRSPSGSIVWHVHPCRKQHKQNKELSSLVVAHLVSTKALVRFVQLKKICPTTLELLLTKRHTV